MDSNHYPTIELTEEEKKELRNIDIAEILSIRTLEIAYLELEWFINSLLLSRYEKGKEEVESEIIWIIDPWDKWRKLEISFSEPDEMSAWWLMVRAWWEYIMDMEKWLYKLIKELNNKLI